LAEAPPIPESLPTQEEPLAGDALTEVETPIPDPVPSGSAVMSGESSDYSVQSGDTLMKIAFEVYGDLYAWKRIYELNKDVVRDPNRIPRGTKLKLEAPQSPVSVQRSGDRYVIKKGDTLGKISNQVYGTPEKWRKIWDNNRQLIKDPNRIYAGFTLYYENDAGSGSTPGQPLGEAPGSSDPSRVPSSGTSGDTL
jgi:nucleoid-associated protein YgaU